MIFLEGYLWDLDNFLSNAKKNLDNLKKLD